MSRDALAELATLLPEYGSCRRKLVLSAAGRVVCWWRGDLSGGVGGGRCNEACCDDRPGWYMPGRNGSVAKSEAKTLETPRDSAGRTRGPRELISSLLRRMPWP